MQYAYGVKIVSGVVLCNYCLEFNETLSRGRITPFVTQTNKMADAAKKKVFPIFL
jgi:hypothetical protein